MEYLYTFSQDREDLVLYHVLKNEVRMNDVFWIDVGANDPIDISVTKFFSIRGGRGINIEPQEKYVESYKRDRERDYNVFCGVGDKEGVMTLHGEGVLASMKYALDDQSRGGVEVPIKRLTDICNEYIDGEQEIHFLKIDVEGFERQVLKGMDFSVYRPWIICIEATDHRSKAAVQGEWEDLIFAGGYSFACQYGINRFYISNHQMQLKKYFDEINNGVLDKEYLVAVHDETKKYQELYRELLSVKNSKSWRYTEPFRRILLKIRKK